MIRRPPRSTQSRSSAASDVYKRQTIDLDVVSPVAFLLQCLVHRERSRVLDLAGHNLRFVDGLCPRRAPQGYVDSFSATSREHDLILRRSNGGCKPVLCSLNEFCGASAALRECCRYRVFINSNSTHRFPDLRRDHRTAKVVKINHCLPPLPAVTKNSLECRISSFSLSQTGQSQHVKKR